MNKFFKYVITALMPVFITFSTIFTQSLPVEAADPATEDTYTYKQDLRGNYNGHAFLSGDNIIIQTREKAGAYKNHLNYFTVGVEIALCKPGETKQDTGTTPIYQHAYTNDSEVKNGYKTSRITLPINNIITGLRKYNPSMTEAQIRSRNLQISSIIGLVYYDSDGNDSYSSALYAPIYKSAGEVEVEKRYAPAFYAASGKSYTTPIIYTYSGLTLGGYHTGNQAQLVANGFNAASVAGKFNQYILAVKTPGIPAQTTPVVGADKLNYLGTKSDWRQTPQFFTGLKPDNKDMKWWSSPSAYIPGLEGVQNLSQASRWIGNVNYWKYEAVKTFPVHFRIYYNYWKRLPNKIIIVKDKKNPKRSYKKIIAQWDKHAVTSKEYTVNVTRKALYWIVKSAYAHGLSSISVSSGMLDGSHYDDYNNLVEGSISYNGDYSPYAELRPQTDHVDFTGNEYTPLITLYHYDGGDQTGYQAGVNEANVIANSKIGYPKVRNDSLMVNNGTDSIQFLSDEWVQTSPQNIQTKMPVPYSDAAPTQYLDDYTGETMTTSVTRNGFYSTTMKCNYSMFLKYNVGTQNTLTFSGSDNNKQFTQDFDVMSANFRPEHVVSEDNPFWDSVGGR